jgi:hypothetical protein
MPALPNMATTYVHFSQLSAYDAKRQSLLGQENNGLFFSLAEQQKILSQYNCRQTLKNYCEKY